MVWVKETATVAKDTLVRQWPKACRKEGSVTSLRNLSSGFWNGTTLVAQKTDMMRQPTTRCMTDTNLGWVWGGGGQKGAAESAGALQQAGREGGGGVGRGERG